ncbi:MAG: prenyltransferase/squalene oxidase repeat-containing protein [Thermoguttaceae bacterium]|jgi:squalene-hopene/tetraprenyl-beta-curcumene cyclase
MRCQYLSRFVLLGAIVAIATAVLADSSAAPAPLKVSAYQRAVDRAIDFLKAQQKADGSYTPAVGPGITAVVTTGLLRQGRSPDDPLLAASLKYLEGFVQKDGGIYRSNGQLENYETSLGLMCFAEANRDHRYDKTIKNADQYLKDMQWGGKSQPADQSNPSYGGAGYGHHKRPDLSNTSFFIDALKRAGDGPDDPALQRALVFVSRCQNLESEHNTTPFAAKNPDGGFYYTCAAGGESKAEKTANGGLRSYGSMTYSGLKSMIYAGVGPDDPRVKAALKWAQAHYGLDSNPGMGSAGLYYYYHTFAKALDATGLKQVEDDKGAKHDWRSELLNVLVRRQQPNGSWVNEDQKFMETDPNLVTGYALLTLVYCRPAAGK